jgi:hypothetical protein
MVETVISDRVRYIDHRMLKLEELSLEKPRSMQEISYTNANKGSELSYNVVLSHACI